MKNQEQKTLLLVEDDITTMIVETHLLKSFGYAVVPAKSGEEAVKIASGNANIDLVLMDINLGSGMDGTEAARQILGKRHLPIVFLTAHTEKEYVERVRAITRYGYVLKASDKFVIQSSIEMAFELFKAQEALERAYAELERRVEERTAELAKANQALRESEARYRGIFDGATEGIYQTLWQGTSMVANPALAKMLGYDSTVDVVLGVEDSARQVWADPDERARFVRLLEEQETVRAYECRFRRKDGTKIWVSLSSRAVRGPDGRVTYFEGFIEDITKRKQAEEALQESEERYKSLFAAMGEGVVVQYTDGAIASCNACAERITGLSADQMMGRTSDDPRWQTVHEDGSPFPGETHPAMVTLRTGQPCSDVVMGIHKPDGTLTWISINSQPLLHPGDVKPYAVVLTFSDISKRRQMELDAQRLHQELAHISRVATMGELVASLAHELNQPLTAILSNAQAAKRLLASGQPDIGEIREILADIAADDQRAGEVVRRVRSLIKKDKMDHKTLDLNEVIREVLGFLRTDAIIKGVTVVSQLSPGRLPVLGDRIQLQQVLLNLIVNAFDAMKTVPAGERELTVQSRRSEADGVLVVVQDSGCGIPPGKMEQIFEPFLTTKPEGIGMGLPICRSIIKAHGGGIRAESNPGRGASFRFTLPIAGGTRA